MQRKCKRIPPPSGFPCFGWTQERVKQYIAERPLQAGDTMLVHNGQGGMHSYLLARVENPALGRQKRVLLSLAGSVGGATFYRTGTNCFAPTGRTRMLPPVPELMPHLADDVEVWLDCPPYSRG